MLGRACPPPRSPQKEQNGTAWLGVAAGVVEAGTRVWRKWPGRLQQSDPKRRKRCSCVVSWGFDSEGLAGQRERKLA
jgi:hypothetical protein